MKFIDSVDAAIRSALRPRLGAKASPTSVVGDGGAGLAADRKPAEVTGEAQLTERFARACANVCRLLRETVPSYDWVGVYMVEGDELVLASWDGPEATEHVRIPLGEGICGAAASTGETIIVRDVGSDPRYLACFTRTKSELVVPIRLGGRPHARVIGEIDIDSDIKDAFGTADGLLVEAVAERLGRAFEQTEPLGPPPSAQTTAVRSQWEGSGPTQPVVAPISVSAIYEFPDAATLERHIASPEAGGHIYTRWGNPTTQALERTVATLEGADGGALAFASGMAAIATTLLGLLEAGDEIVAQRELYGEATRFITEVLPTLGIAVKQVGVEELGAEPEKFIGEKTKVVYAEVLTNPLLRVLDLDAVAKASKKAGAALVIDNTFLTPCGLQPLYRGVDVVIHSATKYLSGHSDTISGVAAAARTEHLDAIAWKRRTLGTIPGPFDASQVARGIKTLPLRMDRHHRNALAIANHLADSPPGIGILQVLHPGLESHPDHERAKDLFGGGCGMVAFEMDGGIERARRFYDALALCRRAASLGGVETLVSLPVLTSHSGLSEEHLEKTGVSAGWARVSVGLEDPFELARDLVNALEESAL